MRVGLTVLHCQRGVEHEDPLFSPLGKVSVGRGFLNEFVGYQVFVDVFEGRGRGDGFQHTEAESVGLVGLMVGILTHNDHLDV